MMESNLRGELTSTKPIKLDELGLIDAVARSLQISSPKELSELGESLYPAMINSAVISGSTQQIDNLKGHGANLSSLNHDHRTALHIASAEGNEKMVKHLLAYGVSVHIRDRHDRTALMEAIDTDKHEIIKVLVKCGAHMTGMSFESNNYSDYSLKIQLFLNCNDATILYMNHIVSLSYHMIITSQSTTNLTIIFENCFI